MKCCSAIGDVAFSNLQPLAELCQHEERIKAVITQLEDLCKKNRAYRMQARREKSMTYCIDPWRGAEDCFKRQQQLQQCSRQLSNVRPSMGYQQGNIYRDVRLADAASAIAIVCCRCPPWRGSTGCQKQIECWLIKSIGKNIQRKNGLASPVSTAFDMTDQLATTRHEAA